MHTRYRARHLAKAAIPAFALLASACAAPARIQPQFPPAADVEAGQEAKPLPTPAIVTDAQAREDYNAAIENWGDRVHDADVRSCRWMVERGAQFVCGKTSSEH